MNLLFTLDKNYFPQLQVLLTSLKINNPGEHFCIWLLHNKLPEDMLETLERWCDAGGHQFHPIQVADEVFRGAPVNSRYPAEMYYRLLAPHLLPGQVDRVLYLDPDILVINPIRPLWDTDLGDHLFAAAAHTGMTEFANGVNRIRLGVDHDYYNSGVLLMNLEKGREEIHPEELFAYVKGHRKELVLPDQDLLNAMFGKRIRPLDDAIWNYDARNFNNYMVRSSAQYNLKWVMEHTAILHFCGKPKPWKPGYLYRFGMLYLHYEQLARRSWGALSGQEAEEALL